MTIYSITLKDAGGNSVPVVAGGVTFDLSGNVTLYGAMNIPIDITGTPLFSPANPGKVGELCAVVGASFVRPANTTAYASGQLVANSVSAPAAMAIPIARVNAGTGKVARGRLTKSGLVVTNGIFRAHFYKTAPTIVGGDGSAYSTNGALTHIGSMTFDMTGANAFAFTDGVKVISVPDVGTSIIFDAAGGSQNIYALLEARGAYVPASGETFTIALETIQG
jgi:hypothetical protein